MIHGTTGNTHHQDINPSLATQFMTLAPTHQQIGLYRSQSDQLVQQVRPVLERTFAMDEELQLLETSQTPSGRSNVRSWPLVVVVGLVTLAAVATYGRRTAGCCDLNDARKQGLVSMGFLIWLSLVVFSRCHNVIMRCNSNLAPGRCDHRLIPGVFLKHRIPYRWCNATPRRSNV